MTALPATVATTETAVEGHLGTPDAVMHRITWNSERAQPKPGPADPAARHNGRALPALQYNAVARCNQQLRCPTSSVAWALHCGATPCPTCYPEVTP